MEQSITARIQSEMTQQIAQLSINDNGGHRRSRFNRNRSRSRSRSKSYGRYRSAKSGMCWYHSQFSSNARKCIPPCNFQAEN
jgi:hypothetical protein